MGDDIIVDYSDFDDFSTKFWKYKWINYKNIDKALNHFFIKNKIRNREYKDVIGIYKNLLYHLKNQNELLYGLIHKGTPFFWIGWFSFLLKDYDQAIFYIDAALAEDKKKHPSDVWPNSGAAMFFDTRSDDYRLIYDPKGSDTPFFRDLLNEEINIFNTINGSSWTLENDFVDSFVKKIITQSNTAIITTLYSFIFEKNDIIEMINLRGHHGGSTEPMIIHLFKGSLIFETLLKINSSGSPMLGTLIKHLFGASFFEDKKCTRKEIKTYEDVIDYIKKDEFGFPFTAFCVTQKIRTLSAHDLNWKDNFTVKNYESIYNQIIYAIFYVIENKYF